MAIRLKGYLYFFKNNVSRTIPKGGVIMPRGDGTGPRGEGPKTGRGLGDCATTEGQLSKRRKGLGPCGDGTPRGGGGKAGCRGRRRGPGGVTFYT